MFITGFRRFFPETVGVIHSNKSQNNRFEALKSFNDNKLKVLITTDIVARGLDFDDITHVVNFDIPDEPENYMHRIGRTGRVDKEGGSKLYHQMIQNTVRAFSS